MKSFLRSIAVTQVCDFGSLPSKTPSGKHIKIFINDVQAGNCQPPSIRRSDSHHLRAKWRIGDPLLVSDAVAKPPCFCRCHDTFGLFLLMAASKYSSS
jgi:hypothetical protein